MEDYRTGIHLTEAQLAELNTPSSERRARIQAGLTRSLQAELVPLTKERVEDTEATLERGEFSAPALQKPSCGCMVVYIGHGSA